MFANLKAKINDVMASDKFCKVACTNAAVSVCAVMSSPMIVGAEETGAAASGDTSAITNGFTTITSIMGEIWTFMIGNPLMCCYMAIGIAAASAGLIKKFKRSSR